MKPLFETLPNYKKIEGITFYDGVVVDKNTIYLVGHKDNGARRKLIKYVVLYKRDAEPKQQLTIIAKLKNYAFRTECELSFTPKPELIIYDGQGNKHAISLQNRGKQTEIVDETEEYYRGTGKSRCIGGKKHTVSIMRSVYVRDDNGHQQELGAGQTYQDYETYDKPLDEDGEVDGFAITRQDGFEDVDGFDENHLYAVGGEGDVWRFVDQLWIKCQFPSDIALNRVCCGKDGWVYISGAAGETYVGKEDSWKLLGKLKAKDVLGEFGFDDMVWHNGKVWATSDAFRGVWWMTADRMAKLSVPVSSYGSLYSRDDLLLIAGGYGVVLDDAGEWVVLN